jgi:non-ribosomal peptide synthetase component E (peptide arylation enzyme)
MLIIDELPVLASGKVDKKSLRHLVEQRHLEVIHE